jgi:hypothetical protein
VGRTKRHGHVERARTGIVVELAQPHVRDAGADRGLEPVGVPQAIRLPWSMTVIRPARRLGVLDAAERRRQPAPIGIGERGVAVGQALLRSWW